MAWKIRRGGRHNREGKQSEQARGSRRRPAPTELQRGHELGRGADNIVRYTSPLCRSVSESVDDRCIVGYGNFAPPFDTDKRTHNTHKPNPTSLRARAGSVSPRQAAFRFTR